MTKAQFLAFSLPFGLKCTGATEIHKYNLLSVHIGSIDLCRVKPIEGGIDFPLPVNDIKPILRPLSDLTKEITHNGETFRPLNKLVDLFGYEIPTFGNNILAPITTENFNCVIQLVEWHFDIAGLIDKNEAVDIHTLSVSYY